MNVVCSTITHEILRVRLTTFLVRTAPRSEEMQKSRTFYAKTRRLYGKISLQGRSNGEIPNRATNGPAQEIEPLTNSTPYHQYNPTNSTPEFSIPTLSYPTLHYKVPALTLMSHHTHTACSIRIEQASKPNPTLLHTSRSLMLPTYLPIYVYRSYIHSFERTMDRIT